MALRHFVKDYVHELASAVCPVMASLEYTKHMVLELSDFGGDEYKFPDGFPDEWKDEQRLRKHFWTLLEAAIWRFLTTLVARCVAKHQHSGRASSLRSPSSFGGADTPAQKRARTTPFMQRMAARMSRNIDSSSDEDDDASSNQEQAGRRESEDPQQIAMREIKKWRDAQGSYNLLDSGMGFRNLVQWWEKPDNKMAYPYLSLVASALLSAKPGSGGLECDIGGVKDLISSKRGSLSAGMVETGMFLRFNKKNRELNQLNVPVLDNWTAYIPKRPDYPDDYFDEE